jgi:hypothetical protein
MDTQRAATVEDPVTVEAAEETVLPVPVVHTLDTTLNSVMLGLPKRLVMSNGARCIQHSDGSVGVRSISYAVQMGLFVHPAWHCAAFRAGKGVAWSACWLGNAWYVAQSPVGPMPTVDDSPVADDENIVTPPVIPPVSPVAPVGEENTVTPVSPVIWALVLATSSEAAKTTANEK